MRAFYASVVFVCHMQCININMPDVILPSYQLLILMFWRACEIPDVQYVF